MLPKKSALGRGLGALIDDKRDESPKIPSNEIPLSQIDVNPFQPRQNFSEEALLELASSIKEYGVIQPITVREAENGRFQIISGERRFRASKLAGLDKIPAYVRHADDNVLLELALVENVQREDLDPIEVAVSYQRLMDEFGFTQESLSEKIGKKRSSISNALRMLKLPAEIQLALRNRKISVGHAKAILAAESADKQIQTCIQIIENDFSVRQAEEQIRKLNTPIPIREPNKKNAELKLKNVCKEFNDQLNSFFPTSVKVAASNEGIGKIVIPFTSEKELETIIRLFEKLKS
jgi:ParB family chromosome partitioning protein